MDRIINGFEPDALFGYFEEISAIPRGSGNERGIADFLCAFAEKNRLEYSRDSANNVIIKRKATAGMEGREPVMLQGHTDMVCEKRAGVVHDFERDGLSLVRKGDMLSADGTTLGGDDGIAVAIMLCALSDPDLVCPDLECVFTTSEETGMGGVEILDMSGLKARRIINIDSEEEGVAVASCAGSMVTVFSSEPETLPFAGQAMKLSVSGLFGGHSGSDINAGRANAVLLTARILAALYEEEPFNLISVNGGNKRNAIPRECEAVISVSDREKAVSFVNEYAIKLRRELCKPDRKVKIHASRCAKAEKMLAYKDTGCVLSFFSLLPNGVLSMSNANAGMVESSSNLGITKTESGKLTFDVYSRSSNETVMDSIRIRMLRLAKVTGLQYNLESLSPGWDFNPDSRLQKDYVAAYKKLFPKRGEPVVAGIHAGLECGEIIRKLGGGDAIAIGPDMRDIHTPDETLDLCSCERTWKLISELLRM